MSLIWWHINISSLILPSLIHRMCSCFIWGGFHLTELSAKPNWIQSVARFALINHRLLMLVALECLPKCILFLWVMRHSWPYRGDARIAYSPSQRQKQQQHFQDFTGHRYAKAGMLSLWLLYWTASATGSELNNTNWGATKLLRFEGSVRDHAVD
jgi:hypothetical protein